MIVRIVETIILLTLAVCATTIAALVVRGLISRACERCGVRLPILRKPSNEMQALIGGWTCHKCGAELDSDRQVLIRQIDSEV